MKFKTISAISFALLLPLSAPAEVIIMSGSPPKKCFARFYSTQGDPSLFEEIIYQKNKFSLIRFRDNPPESIKSKTVEQWVRERAKSIIGSAPDYPADTPFRTIPVPSTKDLACRDKAELLVKTLSDAAEENRLNIGKADYIPYHLQGFLEHLYFIQ